MTNKTNAFSFSANAPQSKHALKLVAKWECRSEVVALWYVLFFRVAHQEAGRMTKAGCSCTFGGGGGCPIKSAVYHG